MIKRYTVSVKEQWIRTYTNVFAGSKTAAEEYIMRFKDKESPVPNTMAFDKVTGVVAKVVAPKKSIYDEEDICLDNQADLQSLSPNRRVSSR